MAEPSVIIGPAIVGIGSTYVYTEGNITERLVRETFSPRMSMVGEWDARLKSQLVRLSFTPAGAISAAQQTAVFPYAPSGIGTNVMAAGTDIIIWTKAGQKITYAVGAVSKCPQIRMGVGQTWLGDMEITAKSDPTLAYTHATAWTTVAATALSDTTWNETLVKTGAVLVSWGTAPTAVFTDAGTIDGCTIDIDISTEPLQPDGYNIVGMILTGIRYRARFKPQGWSEANFYSYLRLQDTTAIVPGASLSNEGKTFTAANATAGLTVAITNMGPESGEQNYDLAGFRGGEVVFIGRHSWTAGVINNPLTITIT